MACGASIKFMTKYLFVFPNVHACKCDGFIRVSKLKCVLVNGKGLCVSDQWADMRVRASVKSLTAGAGCGET